MSNLIKSFDTSVIDYSSAEVVKTLQNTVAQGTSPEEFAVFVGYCKATGLNPLKKEVWCIKAGGRLQIMTGINGYWQIANSHESYDGMEGPDFEYDDKGRPVSCSVKVYRKDRRFPAVGVAFLEEDSGQSPVWKQRPRVMLQKVAETRALRKAFPQELNGTYTAEEMPEVYSAEPSPGKLQSVQSIGQKTEIISGAEPSESPDKLRTEVLKSYAKICKNIAEIDGLDAKEVALKLASSILGRDVADSSEINLEEAQDCLSIAVDKLEAIQ